MQSTCYSLETNGVPIPTILKSAARAIVTALLVGTLLFPTLKVTRGVPAYILSGEMFKHRFDSRYDIGALDEPGLQDNYFAFTVSAILYFPMLALARWLNDRQSRIGYWTLVVCACVTAWMLILILLPGFYLMLQYIASMGVTRARVLGVFYALVGFAVTVLMTIWVAWPPRRPY